MSVDEIDGVVIEEIDKDENAVEASLKKKSDLSYYHAHGKAREDLSAATKITGDLHLCNPDGVEKLDEKDPRYFERLELSQPKVVKLEKYMIDDSEKTVKVYLEFPTAEILRDGEITTEFEDLGMCIKVKLGMCIYEFLVRDQPYHERVWPEKTKYRISSDKTRMSITLFKMHPDRWPNFLKKNLNRHTGWE